MILYRMMWQMLLGFVTLVVTLKRACSGCCWLTLVGSLYPNPSELHCYKRRTTQCTAQLFDVHVFMHTFILPFLFARGWDSLNWLIQEMRDQGQSIPNNIAARALQEAATCPNR